jgi:hypothetical protein
VLIFQKSRLGEQGEKGYNWEIKKAKRGKTTLFFGTEGSDGTMKWNGKNMFGLNHNLEETTAKTLYALY